MLVRDVHLILRMMYMNDLLLVRCRFRFVLLMVRVIMGLILMGRVLICLIRMLNLGMGYVLIGGLMVIWCLLMVVRMCRGMVHGGCVVFMCLFRDVFNLGNC